MPAHPGEAETGDYRRGSIAAGHLTSVGIATSPIPFLDLDNEITFTVIHNSHSEVTMKSSLSILLSLLSIPLFVGCGAAPDQPLDEDSEATGQELVVSDTKAASDSFAGGVHFGGKLILSYIGTDQQINLMYSSDGGISYSKVATGEKGPGGATLAVYKNALYMLWIGTDKQFNVRRSTDGVSWPTKKATGIYAKYVSDGVANLEGKLQVALTRTNGQISICGAANGVDFSNANCYNVNTAKTPNPPSIVSNGSKMWLAWASTKSNHEVNVSTYQGNKTWSIPVFPDNGRPGLGLLSDGTPVLMTQYWSDVVIGGQISLHQLSSNGTWVYRRTALTHYSNVTPTPIRQDPDGGIETVFVGTDGQVNLDWF